jgi:lysophospholipid hydrolase
MVNRLTMSAVVDPSSVMNLAHAISTTPSSLAQYATSSAEQTLSAQLGNGDAKTNMWGSLARFVLFLLSIIPGILFWLITFTTITLPTWLFTLFSTSLTFTMNATTLYVCENDC